MSFDAEGWMSSDELNGLDAPDAEGWMSSDELNGLDAPSEFVSAPGDGGGSSTSLVSASMMPRTKTPLEPAASRKSKPPPPFFGKRRRYRNLIAITRCKMTENTLHFLPPVNCRLYRNIYKR